jgi:peptidyl-prolyl cis-trans isomerase C
MYKIAIQLVVLALMVGMALNGKAAHSNSQVSVSDGRSTMDVEDLNAELLAIPSAQRVVLKEDKRRLARYVESILSNRRAMELAKLTDIANLSEVVAETARARRDAIARIYIERLLAEAESRLPENEALVALAKERYLTSKNEYAFPETIRVAHILLKIDVERESPTEAEVRSKAEKILNELRGGADFAKYAEQYSEDTVSGKAGGLLSGLISRGQLVPPFEKVAFNLPVGEVSNLVRTRFGLHIIKVLDRRPAGIKSFEEVRDSIVKQLRDQQMTVVRGEIMAPINRTQEVEISDEFMEALKRR